MYDGESRENVCDIEEGASEEGKMEEPVNKLRGTRKEINNEKGYMKGQECFRCGGYHF